MSEELDFTKFQATMTKAAKAVAHNAEMKKAFGRLVSAVEDVAKVFADDYEPAPKKERAKRGTGKAALAKAAQASESGQTAKAGKASKK